MDGQVPESMRIVREKGVPSVCSGILGMVLGDLIDRGLTDLEILTVVEDILKLRTLVSDPRFKAVLEKQMDLTREAFKKGD